MSMRRFLEVPFLFALIAAAGACAENPAPSRYPNPGQWQPNGGNWGGPQYNNPGPLPPPIIRPVNVPAILALGNLPCAPKEVAPGTWARFDCGPFVAVTRAMQYIPMPRFNLVAAGPVPAAVDHRMDGTEGPVKDQGAVGVCTAVSLSSAMDNAVRRMGRQDVLSALHIWSKYGVPTMGDAGDKNVEQNLTVEQTWAYDPAKACKISREPFDSCSAAYGVASGSASLDPAIQAENTRADASGRYKLAALEKLQVKPANIDEVSAVLAGGDDVWASFWVNDEAWMSRSLQNAVIPDYETNSNTGHAVVLAGYRTIANGTKQFLVHNSWGTRWGDQGYGWLSEAMVAKYMRAGYRVRVTDAGAPSIPGIPGVSPTPSAGACPSGQVKDTVLGRCAPACAGGSAPAAGVCLPGGLPGFPTPGSGPAPQQPQQPQQNSCGQGQAPDVMTGKCTNTCAGGAPAVGGMCLPFPR